MRDKLSIAAVEVAFIVFLFYANLLMGEYVRSGAAHDRGMAWAMADVVTRENLAIALVAALVGHVAFEWLRRHLR